MAKKTQLPQLEQYPVRSDDEVFRFLMYRYNVSAARHILETKPRPPFLIGTEALKPQLAGIWIDEDHAATTDTDKPVIMAHLLLPATEKKPESWELLLIDGHHRVRKALSNGLEWIGLYLLMPDESEQIRF